MEILEKKLSAEKAFAAAKLIVTIDTKVAELITLPGIEKPGLDTQDPARFADKRNDIARTLKQLATVDTELAQEKMKEVEARFPNLNFGKITQN